MTERTIKEDIDEGFKEFSLYTVYNRAIPSAIDGFKPGQRKIVYAMLQYPSNTKQKVKISDLGSISRYNFHHGESSAQATAVGMAAPWANNAPIFVGHGNFGSRKVPEPAAPRYIFATLHKNFETYFKDNHVCPVSLDPDDPEPAYYLPTIPWVLVNGVRGIAVGFATNILPRSPKDLIKAVKKCLDAGGKPVDVGLIYPTFPDFKGTVTHVEGLTWKIRGIVTEEGSSNYRISEVPYGMDRAEVFEHLSKLCDDGVISDFTDDCSDKGFSFKVKLTREQKISISKDPHKAFKMERQVTENLVTIGHDGKIRIFDTVSDLVNYFVSVRLVAVQSAMDVDLAALELDRDTSIDRINFINHVIDGFISFNVMTKQSLLDYISKNITDREYGKSFINIPIYTLTNDTIKTLTDEIADLNAKIAEAKIDTAVARYNRML